MGRVTACRRQVRAALARVGPAALRRTPLPVLLTVVLTAAMAAVGAAIAASLGSDPLLGDPGVTARLVFVPALAAAFLLAELSLAHVEVRRQAYSFSLAGVPLVLGLLYCPPRELIAARLVAAVAAFAIQRASLLKSGFNTASYLLDTALVLLISELLVGSASGLDLRVAGWCYLSLALVDQAMSWLVLLVIRINQGPVTAAEAAEVLLPAAAFVLVNTSAGLVCAVLLGAGALGAVLLAGFVALTAVTYRGYLVLRRRHQSLEQVQEFIEHSEVGGGVDELAERLLTHIRAQVRAGRVELSLYDRDGVIVVAVDDDGTLIRRDGADSPADALLMQILDTGEPVRIHRKTADAGARHWLDERGGRDALIVPLTRSGVRGTLVATERLGDTASFTHDDLMLLQALGSHLAVAVHSRELVERLRYDAAHDVLTGLANRALLSERLRDALSSTCAGNAAVLLLDLDRFKEVNDALGHHVGDQLLEVVGERLRSIASAGSVVARLGGDEFAVLLEAGTDAEQHAVAVGERITDALTAPIDLPEATVTTAASVGVAVAVEGQSAADLLRHADTAMYAAKESGVPLVVYTPELDRGRAERLALLADLHLALERDELRLLFQPKLDLASGVVTSVEALVRWAHPTKGLLGPDRFVHLAESTGLIEGLTSAVLAKALRQARSWQDEGIDLAVAVNLSTRNLNDATLPQRVTAALAEWGLPARKLLLEITETSVMGDPERTVPVLDELAGTGVGLSLDDFGTGYSSLSYLQRLPVREVKIDRSFVVGLRRPAEARASEALVRSIITLGRSLGLRIVAEGVESAEVMDQLRDLGCDVIQGYHIGRPMTPEQLRESGLPLPVREASGRALSVA